MKKPLIIVIEGTDNTGKDTQQKLIIKNFSDLTFHCFHYSSLPFKDKIKHIEYSTLMYDDMFSLIKDNLDKTDRNFIFNRSHLGEAVYSPLYRDYSGDYVFDIEEKWIDDLKDHIYLIVLTNDPKTILKRDDGLSFYKDEKGVQNEIELFEKAFDKSKIKNKILINVGDKNAEEVGMIIEKFIKNESI
mgnify:CR=1 FL=1